MTNRFNDIDKKLTLSSSCNSDKDRCKYLWKSHLKPTFFMGNRLNYIIQLCHVVQSCQFSHLNMEFSLINVCFYLRANKCFRSFLKANKCFRSFLRGHRCFRSFWGAIGVFGLFEGPSVFSVIDKYGLFPLKITSVSDDKIRWQHC